MTTATLVSLACLFCCADLTRPDPAANPGSSLMLDLPGTGTDPAKIDFAALPTVPAQHAVVSRGDRHWQFRLHNYLAYHDGRYFCFWSHGPVIEDQARQHLQYATSADGLKWSEPKILAPPPREGFGYIARGLWLRDGELLALASLFEAPAYDGGQLELVAFRWNAEKETWQPAGRVFDNALNNFAPKKLPTGEWMMSRRASDRSVSLLIGGVKAIDDWRVVPFSTYALADGGRPEEPFWWTLPSGAIVGVFRDNGKSGRLLRSFSTDNGHTWTKLVRTNFPDATSKFNVLQTSRGTWVMISNPNPQARNPLCLSTSSDGLVFTRMVRLPIPAALAGVDWVQNSRHGTAKYESLQYPHVIEHDGSLLIAYSRRKQTVEVLKIPVAEIDALVANPPADK
jgi:BNR repeat-like domain